MGALENMGESSGIEDLDIFSPRKYTKGSVNLSNEKKK